jgi:hypothetical protein
VDGLGRKVLVAAFDGWNDAGEAASAAVAHLRESGAYEPVFSVDPELYFDYQYTRPQVSVELARGDDPQARQAHPFDAAVAAHRRRARSCLAGLRG